MNNINPIDGSNSQIHDFKDIQLKVKVKKNDYNITSTRDLTKSEREWVKEYVLKLLGAKTTSPIPERGERVIHPIIRDHKGEINSQLTLRIENLTAKKNNLLPKKEFIDIRTRLQNLTKLQDLGIATRPRAEAVTKKRPPPISFAKDKITNIATDFLSMKDPIVETGANLVAAKLNTLIGRLPIAKVQNQNDLKVLLLKSFKESYPTLVNEEVFTNLYERGLPPEFSYNPKNITILGDFLNESWNEGEIKKIYIPDTLEIRLFSIAIDLFFQDPDVKSVLEPYCPAVKEEVSPPLSLRKTPASNNKIQKKTPRSIQFSEKNEIREIENTYSDPDLVSSEPDTTPPTQEIKEDTGKVVNE